MLTHIRPFRLFKHLKDNKVELVIPTHSGVESLTVFSLETLLLIAAARLVEAKSILEIGTSLGYTSMHLAMNTKASVTTVDIEDKQKVYGKDLKINQIVGTAQTLSPALYDMVFIDADHAYESVARDTKSVMKFYPKLIAWHDYGNPSEPGVKKFLDELAEEHDIYHVEDSWICLLFMDRRTL